MAPEEPAEPALAAARIPEHPTLPGLREAAAGCTACPLWKIGTQTVFGEGPARAEIMMVGEVPGNDEDLAGRPFVGPAGRLLDQALEEAGIDRRRVYVTNVVKHFKWEPHGKRRLHKKPSAREIAACRPWLDAEIRVVRPRVIVCLRGDRCPGFARGWLQSQPAARGIHRFAARGSRDGDRASLVDPARARR